MDLNAYDMVQDPSSVVIFKYIFENLSFLIGVLL